QLYQPKNQFSSLIQLQSQLFILLLPIQLYLFGTVSLLSPALNFIAIPFVSFLLLPLLLLLVFFILLAIPGIEFLLWMTEQLLIIFWKALTSIAPFSEYLQFSSTEITIWHLLCYPFLLLLLLTFQLRVKITIIGTLMLLMVEQKQPDLFRMMIMDVGQGLAVSIDYHNKYLIYDTAYGSEDFSVAEMTILPWLNSISVSSVDLLVIGHGDADHAGGARFLMNLVKIKELVTGPDVKVPEGTYYTPHSISSCELGQQWKWDNLIIRVLSPEAGNRHLKEGNDTSCVLLFEINGKRILLTGDIEVEAEEQLLKNYPNLTADVLFIPHHGSKTSSTAAFVEQVNPKIGIISSGYLNRFNLPAENIIKRYHNQSVEIFNTAYSGAIELTINTQGNIAIKQWRLHNRTLWRRH
ncbi:MAG: DNA internalization-related competence protein ComEC/Rec2, partial [Gammaproteobacteria bacterium]|nr:DNA internalization-related competence protein ComEC/Rec2 [Gammaproteobacteria bacterium]